MARVAHDKQDRHIRHPERSMAIVILLCALGFLVAGTWAINHGDSWLVPGLILLIWGIGGITWILFFAFSHRDK